VVMWRVVLAVLVLVLVVPQSPGAAVRTGRVPRVPFVEPQDDGSMVARAPSYKARVGADGNLHSFRIANTELLDDRVAISLGAFLYADGPLELGKPSKLTSAVVEAAATGCAIRYRFTGKDIRITLKNSATKPLAYFVVLSPEITIVTNIPTKEAAAAPATEKWSNVRFTTKTGAYIELLGGVRIWGPWFGRQVWEITRIQPGQAVELRVRGGVAEPPQATLAQLLGVTAKIASTEAVVPTGDPVELQVSVENRSEEVATGLVSVELSGCKTDSLITSSSPLVLPPKQSTGTFFRAAIDAPDFYRARVTLTVDGRQVSQATAVAGYRVSEIAPAVTTPRDFHAFWQVVASEVGSAAPVYHMRRDDRRSRGGVVVWVVKYEGLGGKQIHGWYLHPESPTPRPALLYLSGYGGRPITPPVALAKHGYVVLAIDVRGNAVDRRRPRPFEDYYTAGIRSPETYVYREIVSHCLRAIRLLVSRDEVNPEKVAVVGVSEGGGLALMLGALAPEVRAVAADAPLLCDFPLSLGSAAWPYTEIVRYLQEHPEHASQARETLSYFDIVNFAPDIKCPVLISVGFLDRVSLPAAVYGLFNSLPGPKQIRALPGAGHEGGGAGLWAHKLAWLKQALGQTP